MFYVITFSRRNEERVEATVDDFCPVHGTIHPFELVAMRRVTRVCSLPVHSKPLPNHRLRSTEPCRHQRRVDPLIVEAVPAHLRWAERLQSEDQLHRDPSAVPEETLAGLLRDLVTDLDVAGFGVVRNPEIGRSQAAAVFGLGGRAHPRCQRGRAVTAASRRRVSAKGRPTTLLTLPCTSRT